jgi:hypothetical protein
MKAIFDLVIPASMQNNKVDEFFVCPKCGFVSHDLYKIRMMDDAYTCKTACRKCGCRYHSIDTDLRCQECIKQTECLFEERMVVTLIAMSVRELDTFDRQAIQSQIRKQLEK